MDKENIMMIEFQHLGIEMIALFNYKMITEEDVRYIIQLYGTYDDDNVIIITKVQFDSVFFGKN